MTQESRLVIVIDSKNAERNTRAVADELANLTVKGDQADAKMTAMSASIKSLVGYMGGILTISKAISMADGYTQMAARIRNATASAAEYSQVQDRLLATANTTFRALGEAQEVYLSMAGGMKSLGKSTKDTLDLTDSLSFSFTHNATRVDQAQSAMDALSKSMAKGKVDGDAWISIVTGADNVIADMAKTTGKTEAEIRKLGAEGKASLEDLIKTLIATREQNEKLANNMENSLADGFTKLSNEVTVYLGKANESTSATGLLASGLGNLADNLDAVANTGAVLGIGYVTTALLTKGAVVKKDIIDSMAYRAATKAQALASHEHALAEVSESAAILKSTQAQVANTQATLAAIAAEKALEAERLKAQMNSVGRTAAVTRMAELKKVEALVTRELAVAETALAAAQARSTSAATAAVATTSRLALAARGVLSFLGGPVGLGITVASLAAGYFMMSNSADKVNAKLEEQAAVAKKAKEELLALQGLEKDDAIKNMTEAFERQNQALSDSSSKINMQLTAIERLYAGNKEVAKIVNDARDGTISMKGALVEFNKIRINKDVYNSFKENSKEFEKNAKEATTSKVSLNLFGFEVELAGRKAQVAKNGLNENTEALNKNETAAQKAARAQAELSKTFADRKWDAGFKLLMVNKGYTESQAEELLKAYKEATTKGLSGISKETQKVMREAWSVEDQLKSAVDARTEAEKKATKEKEKQYQYTNAELKMLQKVAGLSAKNDLDGIGAKYGIPKNYLAGLMAQESKGNANAVSPTGAIGYFQTTKDYRKDNGITVADSKNLPVIAEVVAKNLATAYKKLGSWEAAIRSHNAGVAGSARFEEKGNVAGSTARNKEVANFAPSVNKWIVGLGGSGLKSKGITDSVNELKDYYEFEKEQANLQKQLQLDVANEVTKIRENLKDKLEEIDKAGFSTERTSELKAEYQFRADTEIVIAKFALKTKLDDYSAFKETEDELLKDSFDQKKFYASRDIELSKDQRDEAVALLDEQLKHEQAMLILARETRMFQMREQFMSEASVMEIRYALEEKRLIEINDLEERNFKQQMLRLQKQEAVRDRINNAVLIWGQTEAEMNGKGEQRQIEQIRFNRYDQSQELFDAQLSVVNQQAENPNANMEEIAAQREAIWQAHHNRMTAIESDYQTLSYSLQLSYGQQVAGALTGMFGSMLGESSSAYRALYAAQQSFALAQAGMNVWKSASDAYANEPGTVWQKMGAAALATIESGTFVSMIQAATPKGFKSGGYTGNYGTSAVSGVVHGQEYVLNAAATKRVGVGALNAINSGKGLGSATVVQPKVIINNYSSEKVETSTNSDGELMVTIGKMMDQKIDSGVDRGIQRNLRQGHPLANAIKGR